MVKKLGSFLAPMVALMLVIGTGTGFAAVVTINNPSFEDDSSVNTATPGGFTGAGSPFNAPSFPNTYSSGENWVSSGGSVGPAGEWNPTSSDYSSGVPDGQNVAYINSGYIYQILTATLEANTVYTLSGYIGDRIGGVITGNAIVELIAGAASDGTGGTVIASDTISSFTPNTFAQWSASSTSYSPGDPLLGEALTIELGAASGNGQVNYDLISLTAVPEPVNMALAAFGILVAGGTAGRRLMALRNSPKF